MSPTSKGHTVIYGVSINNNPTVQDLWNSTAAWGQPSSPRPSWPVPAASHPDRRRHGPAGRRHSPGYAFLDQSLYAEAGVYRSALQGASVAQNGNLSNNVISGVAPYWRVAYEADWGQNSWEVGGSGLEAALREPHHARARRHQRLAAGGAHRPLCRYQPGFAVPVHQRRQPDHGDRRAVHEDQRLNASYPAGLAGNPTNFIDSENLVASYFWRRKIGIDVRRLQRQWLE